MLRVASIPWISVRIIFCWPQRLGKTIKETIRLNRFAVRSHQLPKFLFNFQSRLSQQVVDMIQNSFTALEVLVCGKEANDAFEQIHCLQVAL
jgi:hypothetical protein